MKPLIAVLNLEQGPSPERLPISSGSRVIIFEITQKELSNGTFRLGAVIADELGRVALVPFTLLTILGTAPEEWTPAILVSPTETIDEISE